MALAIRRTSSMNVGITVTLQRIYDHLPLYAEEGGDYSIVNVSDLTEALHDIEGADALPVILFVQRIFTLLGLLDENLLPAKVWRFVSFPASLLARSVLQSLADSDSSLFESGFWNQHDSNSPVSDQQRRLLHEVETQRKRNHNAIAAPVRHVHVAWGLIVLDGKVLLRHREDKNRSSVNNYVLIGGRVSQADLKKSTSSLSTEAALSTLQGPLASENTEAIEIALQREINEETGLDPEKHYVYRPWRTVKPYTAVEGAGANHALTEYRIHIYHVQLTQKGLFALYERIGRDEYLNWFTLEEFSKAKTSDGKMAYIDALKSDFSSKEKWLSSALGLPASYENDYRYHQDGDAITLPVLDGDLIEKGKTGKERELNIHLSAIEKSLLLGLQLISAVSDASIKPNGIQILGFGWVRALDEEIKQQLRALTLKLDSSNLPIIECRNEDYFRISVDPSQCFLSDAAYRFSIEGQNITLKRDLLKTPFFDFSPEQLQVQVSKNLAEDIERIAVGDLKRRHSEDDIKSLVRRHLKPICHQLGLRALVRTVAGGQVIKAQYIQRSEDL